MNIRHLISGLENGTITLNTNGHEYKYWDDVGTKEIIISMLKDKEEHWITQEAKHNEPDATVDMKSYYQKLLCADLLSSQYFGDSLFSRECSKCGKNLFIRATSPSSVELHYNTYGGSIANFSVTPVTDPCVCSQGQAPIETHINIASKLYFVNHFGMFPDNPEKAGEVKVDYSDINKYSINFYRGLVNTSTFLASKNIGYGQVGNTSVYVYVHKDGKRIAITEFQVGADTEDLYELEVDQNIINEVNIKYKDYELLGDISLGVWRWMCADQDTIRKYNLNLNNEGTLEERVINDIHTYRYYDVVECDVAHGKWKITHYHNTDKHLFDGVTVSTLELIEGE